MKKIIMLALVAGVVASANADVMRFTSLGRGKTISYKFNGSTVTGFAGELNFRQESTGDHFTTMCIDLQHHISIGNQWSYATQDSLSASTELRRGGNVYGNNFGGLTNNDEAAALQIAVWATRYGLNLTTNTNSNSNSFKLDSGWYGSHGAIVAKAIQYANSADVNHAALLYNPIPSTAGQGQVGAVPEPATLVALGLGLAAAARRRRKLVSA